MESSAFVCILTFLCLRLTLVCDNPLGVTYERCPIVSTELNRRIVELLLGIVVDSSSVADEE